MSPNNSEGLINLLILTPIFPPTTGGAGVYYGLLSQALIDKYIVDKIVVVTEKIPNKECTEVLQNGRLIIVRLFPHRAGANRQLFLQYVKYIVQNFRYIEIPAIVAKYSIDILLVHSSFHNFPNLLSYSISKVKKNKRCRLVADVRDWQMPVGNLKQLECYDSVVTCSENTYAHVTRHSVLKDKTELIPVIQEEVSQPSNADVEKLLQRFDITTCKYLSYIGLVKAQKGVKLLFDAFSKLADSHKDLHLIVAGTSKDSNLLREITIHPRVHYIGPISRQDALVLASGAQLCANLSDSEGMPRSSLEALALGTRVALPPNIPEFMQYCSEYVVNSINPEDVAKKLDDLLCSSKMVAYPIHKHRLDSVCQKYAELFNSIVSLATKYL